MPGQALSANRHPLRVWIKWALETGLFEKLPSEYAPAESKTAHGTISYARDLLAELRNPDSSKRTLQQIIADARHFRTWVEARQKDYRRLVLRENGSQRLHWAVPAETRPSISVDREIKPGQTRTRSASPRSNPMWDDWLDT
jgi:hypothetical protein